MKLNISKKYKKIRKANSFILIVIGAASVVTIFCFFSTKALFSQASFQRKVLSEKNATVDTLKEDVESAKKLQSQYQIFRGSDPNILGGSKNGSGPKDGDNARIVLDALPSSYDFPALASSIEKMLKINAVSVQSISGTDEGTKSDENSEKIEPVPINFGIEVVTNYAGAQNLVKDFERSIRPFDVVTFSLTGNQSSMRLSASINTYYQAQKSFDVTNKVVK